MEISTIITSTTFLSSFCIVVNTQYNSTTNRPFNWYIKYRNVCSNCSQLNRIAVWVRWNDFDMIFVGESKPLSQLTVLCYCWRCKHICVSFLLCLLVHFSLDLFYFIIIFIVSFVIDSIWIICYRTSACMSIKSTLVYVRVCAVWLL